MTTIGNALPAELFGSTTPAREQDELGQEEFLRLMITQLENQDPLKPMESGDFLGQIAQFGTVSGIQGLQEAFSGVAQSLAADRALRGASLIGRSALVPGPVAQLPPDGSLSAAIDLPEGTADLVVEITDPSGARVDLVRLGPQGAGLVDFTWDGLLADGSPATPGSYVLAAKATSQGRTEQVPVLVRAEIRGVELARGDEDMRVDIGGRRSIPVADIRRID
ncbi:MAG: flagellar hook capping FlgD N-terminal domain-containing protein [Pseudomonadales bacterium]|jgi:flagellar basal-body rod modification protein FlgD|nr:flagellar hook capping FlgD N-terminal domain-containing protein [Pseudomonadales bacterium]